MTCTPGEEYEVPRCFMPNCPNRDQTVPTIEVDIGDETGLVLRSVCADCLNVE